MSKAKGPAIEVPTERVEEILRRLESGGELTAEDFQILRDLLATLRHLTDLIGDKATTIARLRKLLFGATTESTKAVLASLGGGTEGSEGTGGSATASAEPTESIEKNEPRKGHGRNGADAYTAAERIAVPHTCLKPGDPCPACERGRLYARGPERLVRLVGTAPVTGRIYELERLRCNLCRRQFRADPPEGVGTEKYDASVAAMVALLKYGSGLPFYRLQALQRGFGIPLPVGTQWDLVDRAADFYDPVFEELLRTGAAGDVLYNDDTTMRVNELASRSCEGDKEESKARQRTGIFTTGIVSETAGRRIAIFVTGRQHAGENLKDLLSERAGTLGPPIQMCDALSRNIPEALRTIIAHCLVHARRNFVDIVKRFPEACMRVIEDLRKVYVVDAKAKEERLTAAERLALHRSESGPVMEGLAVWMKEQFEKKVVEPNSALGSAINYMQNHWEKLTLFLKVEGAPLDNNVCERALKRAILHRKNALFYKTQRGAEVGDLYMSLIHTAELAGVSPYDYLCTIARRAKEAAADPSAWMPWNYLSTATTSPS